MLKAMPYYGGKARAGINRWIRSLLPTGARLYVEPFAGMLSVLLNRPRARCEIASDTNRHIMRWWEAVRLRPEELGRRLLATPAHRGVHEQACRMLFKDGAPLPLVDHAWAVSVVISDSIVHCCAPAGRTWAPTYGSARRLSRSTLAARVSALAERISDVQFETRPACQILERTARQSDALIYCDPPYGETDCKPYGAHQVEDQGRLSELLQAQRGRVAVSGRGSDFDHLGWDRHELATIHRAIARGVASPRIEVLWVNYSTGARAD